MGADGALVIRQEPDTLEMVLSGDIDLASAIPLQERAIAAVEDLDVPVVLDLRNVTFMDSTGLRLLLMVGNASRHCVTLRGASDSTKRLLDLAGFIDGFDLE